MSYVIELGVVALLSVALYIEILYFIFYEYITHAPYVFIYLPLRNKFLDEFKLNFTFGKSI